MSERKSSGPIRLSGRMQAVADLVPEGTVPADVGTDHGYIPIYLVQQKIADRVLALDVRKGPLARAAGHIEEYGLTGQIKTRLSDGLAAVSPQEVDGVILSGMGASLMIRILCESRPVVDSLKYLILQPQSEIEKLRRYLTQTGLRIRIEDMVEEDGKYYPMMRVNPGETESYEEFELYYGKIQLQQHPRILQQYLLKEQDKRERLLAQLAGEDGGRTRARQEELKRELARLSLALACL